MRPLRGPLGLLLIALGAYLGAERAGAAPAPQYMVDAWNQAAANAFNYANMSQADLQVTRMKAKSRDAAWCSVD